MRPCASLTIRNLSKSFGSVEVLQGHRPRGPAPASSSRWSGPPGCGKSTLLAMIAGLESVTSGEIWIGDRHGQFGRAQGPRHRHGVPVLRALPDHDRAPEHAVRHGGARRAQGRSRTRRSSACRSLLQIEPLLNRKPGQLSGGQRQRVAMGRALVRDPQLFLFDEPLSNLDAKLRVEMRTEIKKLHHRVGKTTVYVTHDQVEAMTLASRIAVMHQGSVQQFDEPQTDLRPPGQHVRRGLHGLAGDELHLRRAGRATAARPAVALRRRRRPRQRCRSTTAPAAARRRQGRDPRRPARASLPLDPDLQARTSRALAQHRRRRSSWSSRPAPRPWRCCGSASAKSSAASTPTAPPRMGENITLGVDMSHACLFDPDDAAADLRMSTP